MVMHGMMLWGIVDVLFLSEQDKLMATMNVPYGDALGGAIAL